MPSDSLRAHALTCVSAYAQYELRRFLLDFNPIALPRNRSYGAGGPK